MNTPTRIGLLSAVLAAALNLGAQTVDTVTTNGLFEPYGVAVDLSTNVYYVTDGANNRLVRYDPTKKQQSSLADLQVFSPQGIVLARGGLLVAEGGSHVISLVSFDGDAFTIAGSTRGFKDGRGAEAQFSSPAGLAIDGAGNIFIADTKNNAIRRLAPDDTVTTYATGFYEPAGVAVGEGGRVFVADTRNHVIKMIEPGGSITIIAGRLGVSGDADGSGTFTAPRGLLWVGGETGLLVGDSGNSALRRVYFKSGTWRVTTYAGASGRPGFVNGTVDVARFNSPVGMAVDGNGALLVADLYNGALRRIDREALPLPVFVPAGGSFSNALTLAVTSAVPSAVVRYTTDGTEPTPFSPSTAGAVGLSGGPVLVKARAFSPDFAASVTGSNLFTFFVNPLTTTVPGGLFTNDVSVAISTLTENAAIRFTTDGTDPTTNSPVWTDRVLGASGSIVARGFRDGFAATPILSNNFVFVVAPPLVVPSEAESDNAVTVSMTSATAGAKLYWTTDGTEPDTNSTLYAGPFALASSGPLRVTGIKPGYSSSTIISGEFTFKVGKPVITPEGAAANNPLTVTLSSTTAEAHLYWTIDGSLPTPANGALYTGPFSLATNGTLRVRGFRNGFLTSDEATARFDLLTATPQIAPEGAASSDVVPVTLSSGTQGARIYWTIDGSEPTESSTLYQGPFVLGTNGTLRTRAFRAGFVPSGVASAEFRLTTAMPAITPNGASAVNPVLVTLASATPSAELFWTIDGSEPTPASTRYNGPFALGTNGLLQVRAFRNGFAASPTAAAVFSLGVANPTITPPSATSNDAVPVTLNSATEGAELYWTIDGSEPGTNSIRYSGPFALGTNGVLRVRGFRAGFSPSAVVTGDFRLETAPPVFAPGPGTSINSAVVTITSATPSARLHYTLDGTTPSAASPLYAGPVTITTNSVLRALAVRDGFEPSPITTGEFEIQVDKPVLSPGSGFFPNGTTITITVLRPDAKIYYTLDGSTPTTNDTLYTGPFVFNQVSSQGADLRAVQARAFATHTHPSDIVSGQPVPQNSVGVPRDTAAGIGATVVIPVVVNLQPDNVLRSLQFRIEASPRGATTPSLARDLRVLNITSNDFVQVVGPAEPGSVALLNTSAYRSGTTNGVVVSAIGTNANFAVRSFATVAMLALTVPSSAKAEDSYDIRVLQPSGTSDGQQTPVALGALPPRLITVRNLPYIVGDSSLGTWYNAGEFGDGNLDNSDVNTAFYASLGVRVPYAFTDVFDAMDAFPDDTAGAVGGDGQIRFLDWQRILSRSLRRDPNNWQRSWAEGGVRVAVPVGLGGVAALPAESLTATSTGSITSDGLTWYKQALVGALPVGGAMPGSIVEVPVYALVQPGQTLSGLQFRVAIEGTGPALTMAASFVAAEGMPQPIGLGGLPLNQLVAAWPIVPTPAFGSSLQASNRLGSVRFQIPGNAAPGDCYRLRFLNVDGAADENTQYDLESRSACVSVLAPAPAAQDTLSDEWRTTFFGSLSNLLAEPEQDPDADGVPNWSEYAAGSDPGQLRLQLTDADWRAARSGGLKLRWFAAPGKRYVLECSNAIVGAPWVVLASNILGQGDIKEFIDTNLEHQAQYYRVREMQ